MRSVLRVLCVSMRLILLLAFYGFFIIDSESIKSCNQECNETEYHSYVECIRGRIKRSTDCDNGIEQPCDNCQDNCQQCDCDFCAVNTCHQNCNDCCPNNPPCATNRCCHKTCHARCKSSTCRTECRKTCTEKVTEQSNVTVAGKHRHNITTVINLHNTINNTNVIDVPVQVNSTNVNNITLSDPEKEINPSGQINQENCCFVVSPRQCVQTDKYPFVRCFHYRKRICGQFCTASIIHEQPHEICDQSVTGTSCHQQVIYIPQPQPRCAYQPIWPYVSCGISQPSCGGCYQHYGVRFPQMPSYGCSGGCYDDGYGQGPYYRQGPFYRPGYFHTPSCYQTGTCGIYGYGNPGGYGGYNYIPPNYGNIFEGYGGFPGINYPPATYENTVHFETNPNNAILNFNNITPTDITEINEPPQNNYYVIPSFPHYTYSGYPYAPPAPVYHLAPEVDIQAIITHPEKESRYAQITIDKDQSKREIIKQEEENPETFTVS